MKKGVVMKTYKIFKQHSGGQEFRLVIALEPPPCEWSKQADIAALHWQHIADVVDFEDSKLMALALAKERASWLELTAKKSFAVKVATPADGVLYDLRVEPR